MRTAHHPLLIPTPKQVRFRADTYLLDSLTTIEFGPGWKQAATILAAALARNRPDVRLHGRPTGTLTIGNPGRVPECPKKPEGYAIVVTPSGVSLSARDATGRIWAVQTLFQLIRDSQLSCVEIQDWPALAFRGVHLFHGPNARPFHEKLIERVFSPFKLNGMAIQGDTIGWSALKKSMDHVGSIEDVRAEAIFARRHGIDAFPLIPSHGHMWWLLGGDRAEFREDPESNWAINVTDPNAMKLLARIQDEAATIFGSKNHHLGLDEVIDPVTPRGRVPFRSKLPFAPLFRHNVKFWADWGKRRRKNLWIWADMLMHPSEVRPAFGTAPSVADAIYLREFVPKSFVVVDWQYTARPYYPSLDLLKRAGFEKRVIGTWFDGEGILAFTRAAVANGALGGLQTTWCGYESAESVLAGPERRQFAAMVLAAESFWTGGIAPTWNPGEIFDRAWASRPLSG